MAMAAGASEVRGNSRIIVPGVEETPMGRYVAADLVL
jgi:hypothetical protein